MAIFIDADNTSSSACFSKDFALRSPLSRSDAPTTDHDHANWHPSCFTLPRKEQHRAELMLDNFGDRAKSSPDLHARSRPRKGGTLMFRRMLTGRGLSALAGLSLLLVGGPARADQQGWPVAGNWSNGSGSSSFGSYSPRYSATYPSSFGSYSPGYYATYQTRIPQPGGYYGSGSPANYYQSSTTDGYYGSVGSEGYYRTSAAESSSKRPVLVNLRVPSDAKIWFDGSQTNQTGAIRSFESPPVSVGREYAYEIRIQWKQDGKDVTQTRQIHVHAGDVINLTLGSPAEARPAR
jgi:uncharacterized protein (TIGR03000 family)